MRPFALGALLLLALFSTAGLTAAAPEDTANDISAEVVSPYCPGVTLHDCPSADAVELREKIERWLVAGMTKQEVLDRLEAEYGTTINAAPDPEGTGLVAYVLPIAVVLGGLALVVLVARRWTRRPDEVQPTRQVSEEDHNRIEAELAAMRSEP